MSSTFFVMPARAELGRQFVGYLDGLFPGLNWARFQAADLADTLADLAEDHPNVFVVYREDFAGEESLEASLVEVYGADEGDLVVELPGESDQAEVAAKFWRVGPTPDAADDELPAAA